jgi:hypothetical protein
MSPRVNLPRRAPPATACRPIRARAPAQIVAVRGEPERRIGIVGLVVMASLSDGQASEARAAAANCFEPPASVILHPTFRATLKSFFATPQCLAGVRPPRIS